MVILMRTLVGAPGNSVMAADRDGAELAVRHLLYLGHRNNAFIGGTPASTPDATATRGSPQPWPPPGFELDSALCARGPFTVLFGAERPCG
ncbi:hypothetical protein [Streptomyces sp. NPDC050528]|uniref:hypothetical protein n=1 Tax=unclassified Streptomyces TaxID=2593676 RepID=UPI0037AF956B